MYQRKILFIFVLNLILEMGVGKVWATATHPSLTNDIVYENFEKEKLSDWFILGVPSGKPKGAKIKLSSSLEEFKKGKRGLIFSYKYHKKPVPVLLHRVLLKDFQTMSFWIKSKQKTVWIVSVTDTDGAVFSAKKALPANIWKHVNLTAKDFSCNSESPIQKKELDTGLLKMGYVSFDINNLLKENGKNVIFLDEVKIKRSPIKIIVGGYVLNGKEREINHSTTIEGDLVLINGAQLIVAASRFEVQGDVKVVNSKLIFKNGIWSFPQPYRYANNIIATQGGRIEFRHGFLSMNHAINGIAIDKAEFLFDHVEALGAGFTFNIGQESRLDIEYAKKLGEFVVQNGTTLIAKNSNHLLIWLYCAEGIKADLNLPENKHIRSWTAPNELKRTITVEDSQNIDWGLIAAPGSNITLRDSKLRAVGLHFLEDSHSQVSNIKNTSLYDDFTLKTSQHELRLLNSTVTAWNFYAGDTAELEIHDSVFGESISFGQSTIKVNNSTCDGTGGYIGAKDNSTTIFEDGKVSAVVQTQGRAKFEIKNARIKGNVIATEESNIILRDSTVTGSIHQVEKGKISQF